MYGKDMCYYEGHIKRKLDQVREGRERVIEEVQFELRSEGRIGPTQAEKEGQAYQLEGIAWGKAWPGECSWSRKDIENARGGGTQTRLSGSLPFS